MKKIIFKIFKAANYFFAGLLLLSYLSVYISPEKYPFMALSGISYPILLFVNILFIILWLVYFKSTVFVSLISIAIGYNHLQNTIQLNLTEANQNKSGKIISLLSYNVHYFDHFDVMPGKNDGKETVDFINKVDCDIVCLQEFMSIYKHKPVVPMKGINIKRYPYFKYTTASKNNRRHYFGVATFSKYPILNYKEIKFEGSQNCSSICDLKIDNDTIRLFNLHLQSIKLRDKNYDFIVNPGIEYTEENIDEYKDIGKRLLRAYKMRAFQTDSIKKLISSSPYPVIVCGDFNDTPVSYCYKEISKDLKDAFVESGKGLGLSYTGIFPSFRIDYILHSPVLKSSNFNTHSEIKNSDHYALSSKIYIF